MGLSEKKQRKDKSIGLGDARGNNSHWKETVAPQSPAYRMLLKMGYQEGKGLGRQEDGQLESIKIKNKFGDQKGIGANNLPKSQDNWLSHTEAFDNILANLAVAVPEAQTVTVDERQVKTESRLSHRAKYIKAKQEVKTKDLQHIMGQLLQKRKFDINTQPGIEADAGKKKKKKKRKLHDY